VTRCKLDGSQLRRWSSFALLAVALAACGDGEASRSPAGLPTVAAAIAPPAAAFPPWKSDGDCYWVLTYPDGVAHRAWISGSETGVFLNIVDDALPAWPVSDALEVTLTGEGSDRRLKSRASHRDGDGATLLTVILDEPQRALIAGASRITLASAGRKPFTLPMAGAPASAALDACDANRGHGEFSED
jgi:hypothetical protein